MIPINANGSSIQNLVSDLGEAISENFKDGFKELSSTSAESSVLHVVISDLKKLESQSMTLFDVIKKTDERYKAELNNICKLSDKNKHSKLIAELKAKSAALNKLYNFAALNIRIISKLKIVRLNNDKEFLSAVGAVGKNSDISKAIIELIAFESINQCLSREHMLSLKANIGTKTSLKPLVEKIDNTTLSKLLIKFSEIVDRDNIISDLSFRDKVHLFRLTLTGESFEKINAAKIEAINTVLSPTVVKQKGNSFLSWLF